MDGRMDGEMDDVCVCVCSIFEQENPRIQDCLRRIWPEGLVCNRQAVEMWYGPSEEELCSANGDPKMAMSYPPESVKC